MRVWEEYAIINDGEVKNVICYKVGDGGALLSQVEAVRVYGQNATSENITYIPTGIGDSYHDGYFWKNVNGVYEKINPVPTEEQQITDLNNAVDDILIEILGG